MEPGELADSGAMLRSWVKIEATAKGVAQVKVQVCVGDTAEMMQEALDLAVETYSAGVRKLRALGY
jgi:hypothetical protein